MREWLPGARVGIRKVAAPVAVRVVMAMGVLASRRLRVPVGIPVVVLVTCAVMVAGRVAGDMGRASEVWVGAGVMVRVKAVLWALVWVRSPG